MIRGVALAAVLVVAGVSACSTGSTGGTGSSGPPGTPTDTTSSPSTPPSTTSSAPSATAPSSAATSSGPALVYCTPAQLTVRVLQGGAAQGVEIAAATFTNSSSAPCSLSGYPTVTLLYGGQVRVTASPAAGSAPKPVTLAPGKQAQALIEDTSSCNAPLSDTIRVVAPNQPAGATAYERPFQLRLCTVNVDPVTPAS